MATARRRLRLEKIIINPRDPLFEFSGGENFYERSMNVDPPMNNETFPLAFTCNTCATVGLATLLFGDKPKELKPDMTCRER